MVGNNMRDGSLDDDPSASTINGKLRDLFNCSGNQSYHIYMSVSKTTLSVLRNGVLQFNFEGALEDNYVLDVEPGKTYMLRVINAALFYECTTSRSPGTSSRWLPSTPTT